MKSGVQGTESLAGARGVLASSSLKAGRRPARSIIQSIPDVEHVPLYKNTKTFPLTNLCSYLTLPAREGYQDTALLPWLPPYFGEREGLWSRTA